MYVESPEILWVVGEVFNGTNRNVQSVTVLAKFYNASGQKVAESDGAAFIDVIAKGADAPFAVLLFEPPPGIVRFTTEVTLVVDPANDAPIVGFTVTPTKTSQDGTIYHVEGALANGSGTAWSDAEVVVALYDAGGNVVRVFFGISEPAGLTAGQTGRWAADVDVTGTAVAIARYFVYAANP